MSLADRFRRDQRRIVAAATGFTDTERGEMDELITVAARLRLVAAVAEVDAAIAAVRQGMGRRALDSLLDARNVLTGGPS